MDRALLILFAKAPRAGHVKTRLCPPLTGIEASDLHSALVRDAAGMLDTMRQSADLQLSTDIATDAWSDLLFARSIQTTGDLGSRLLHALQQGLAAGYRQVLILGSDAPNLPAAYLHDLLRSEADVALGPTRDGGFYAIACRKVSHEMFKSVRWSTEYTLADTLTAASSCQLECETGPSWYDVDIPEDLRLMLQMTNAPENVKAWIEQHPHIAKLSVTKS